MDGEPETRRENGWFTRHVVERLDRLGDTCDKIDGKVDDLADSIKTRDIETENRLTDVERKTTLIQSLAPLCVALAAALWFLLAG